MASKEDTNTNSKRLIELVKTKKSKEVLLLLKQNVDIKYTDQTGCTVLHYAASNGLVDVTTAIGEQEKNKSKVFDAKNLEGETAIFYAVKHNQLQVLPALVAFGADINIKDKNNKSPFSLAVDKKNIDICMFLCDVGAEVDITEWGLALMNINMLRRQDRTILELVKEHNTKMKARAYGLIKQKLIHVGKDYKKSMLSELGAEVEFSINGNSFYFYISQTSPEYSPVERYLENKQRIFSDIYYTKCWGNAKMSATMKITVPGQAKCNERLSIVPVEGKQKVTLNNVTNSEDQKNPITKLMISQTYEKDENIQFVTIATILPENFKVPKSGTKIEPKMEPGCCIQIPEGTFESEKLLSVNIAETYDWKTEISGKSDVLFTNVLKVVIAGGAQPKKPVIMTLPLHSKAIKESEVVIISSSKAMPKQNEDWEVVKTANTKIVNAKIVFEVSHFSWVVAANQQSLFESIVQATKAVNEERQVEVYAMLKEESENSFLLVIEWTLLKKAKERRKYWKEKGFQEQSSRTLTIQNNRSYKMVFSDDLIVDDVMLSENRMPMYFDKDKDRSMKMFHLLSSEKTPKGYIYIERQVNPIQENDFEPKIETVENNWIKNTKKPKKIVYENCLTLPIGMQDTGGLVKVGDKRNTATRQTNAAVDEEDDKVVRATPQDIPAIGRSKHDNETNARLRKEIKYKKYKVKVDPEDPQCTIYVLRKRSLRRIGELLTDEECYELGKLLRLEKQILDQLKKGKGKIQDKVFEEWRIKHSLPNASLVEVLAEALEKIGRTVEAEIVKTAHSDKAEFNTG
ncbi:uncharacterized protein LOC143075292 [Mytilus galloprovincialis]|uniref:uncharacterized protein LOC143075292 n=1 Tax=Mytilus galloprovincialis TaxID=29158 RepID=UPI003F7CD16B